MEEKDEGVGKVTLRVGSPGGGVLGEEGGDTETIESVVDILSHNGNLDMSVDITVYKMRRGIESMCVGKRTSRKKSTHQSTRPRCSIK